MTLRRQLLGENLLDLSAQYAGYQKKYAWYQRNMRGIKKKYMRGIKKNMRGIIDTVSISAGNLL